MKIWYEIKAKGKEAAEIFIYDEIGLGGITAKDFIRDLKALGEVKNLTVRINSYGGEIFDGLAIFNALSRHKAVVTVIIDGIAASIASVIAMAGDKVVMPDNAFIMIHRAWGMVMGNTEDMEEWAETLAKFDQSIARAYQRKSGQALEEIEKLMTAETWLTAQEAKALGFADEIADPVKIAARAIIAERFKNPPAALKVAPVPPNPDPPPANPDPSPTPDLEKIKAEAAREAEIRTREELANSIKEIFQLCDKAGVADLASEFVNKEMTVDQVRERLKDAGKIKDRCTAAGFKHRAAEYIKAGMSAAEVSEHLLKLKQAQDPIEIDNKLGPDASRNGETKTVIDYHGIYNRRRINPMEINARYGARSPDSELDRAARSFVEAVKRHRR